MLGLSTERVAGLRVAWLDGDVFFDVRLRAEASVGCIPESINANSPFFSSNRDNDFDGFFDGVKR